jgi:predicted enzyme related to lactoylglutathione lyase
LLVGCGIRFLVPPRNASPNPLTSAISELLEKGTGMLGWTWACQSVHNSREIIEKRSGVAFAADPGGGKTSVVPRRLTPGVTTVLEPLASQELRVHANHAFALDHIVVTVSSVDAVADMYERSFALKARRTEMGSKRYAFLKVGEVNGSVIEIVGPTTPQIGAITGHGWGLAFRTGDLAATVRYLRKAGVGVTEPHEAVQGGRIASVTMQLGGVAITFLEN